MATKVKDLVGRLLLGIKRFACLSLLSSRQALSRLLLPLAAHSFPNKSSPQSTKNAHKSARTYQIKPTFLLLENLKTRYPILPVKDLGTCIIIPQNEFLSDWKTQLSQENFICTKEVLDDHRFMFIQLRREACS